MSGVRSPLRQRCNKNTRLYKGYYQGTLQKTVVSKQIHLCVYK